MNPNDTLSQRWEHFRPSKALWFWSLVGVAIVTMVVGFTVGGWTTGGTAAKMAEKASHDAKAQLAASICVEKFVTANDASAKLAALKEASSWERDSFVVDGGWATLVGIEKPVDGSADLCAQQLAAMDGLPSKSVDSTTTDG